MKKSLLLGLGAVAMAFAAGAGVMVNSFRAIEAKAEIDTNEYTTYLFSTYVAGMTDENNWGTNSVVQARFSDDEDFSSSTFHSMEKIFTNGTQNVYRCTVLSSEVKAKIEFGRWQGGANPVNSAVVSSGTLNGVNYYALTKWNSASKINHTIDYVAPSYQTKRIWFKATCDSWWWNDGALPAVWAGNGTIYSRYLATLHYNNSDSTKYYHVDIPLEYNQIEFQRTDPTSADVNWNTTTMTTFSTSDLHGILTFSDKNVAPTVASPSSYDQYMINEYVKGFTTCLNDERNGYPAYNDIKEKIVDHFVSHGGGTLSNVTQDDYVKTDFVDGAYVTNAVRSAAGSVTCQYKLDAMKSLYDNDGKWKYDSFAVGKIASNSEATVAVIATVSIAALVGGIFVLTRHKRFM